MNNARQIKHLYARAGFGIRFEDLHEHAGWSVKKAVRKLFEASAGVQNINVVTENLDLRYHPNQSEDEKKAIQEERNKQEKALNNAWMQQMASSNAQLREKMTLFWHNHFACNIGNSYYEQQLNNIERTNALGNFKTLLIQVSQAPGMLQFLNNQQNVKNHPNENYARELMELFTMGRGNYTEQDIKESARAFTGWQYDGKTASFVFRPGVHDTGIKNFMGNKADFCGEDIIDIIIKNPVTAKFICTKLYRYLVNDVPDNDHIAQMADLFYKNNYEITPLLEFVFTADWFYDDKNIGNIIKSPVEFLVGLNRQFYVNYQNPDVLMQFQRTLGQVLFRPPNVAGWPGGRSWIDSSSLMYRMKIPSTVLSAGIIDFNGKPTPEDQAYLAATKRQQFNVINKTLTVPDWDKFFQKIPLKTPHADIAQFMLEPTMSANVVSEVESAPDIKTMLIQVVSTPEYQLC